MASSGRPHPRRPGGRLLDALASRLLGLPAAFSDYNITRLRIPLRDGVELAADLYRPSLAAAAKPAGTLLVRGPYGRAAALSVPMARIFAARGYQVLFASSRGTFGSGGEFDPARTEAADGQDLVAWMREQPWFTGTFATIGGSYLGYTQWALLADPPRELAAAAIAVGPHDFSRHHWGTGAFNLDYVGWSDMIAHQEETTALGAMVRIGTAAHRLRPVFDGLPLADAADAYFAGRAPWLRYRLTHPDLSDPYWAPMQHGDALSRVSVPVLLISGWHDIFLGQTIEQYDRLRERGVDVALTVGPWTHLDTAAKAAPVASRETLDWMDEHLAHRASRRRAAPVRVFVTGAREWRDLPGWPAASSVRVLHLHPGGALSLAVPPPAAAPSVFTFDPADPTPSLGGPLILGGGTVDDSRLAARPDVLAYTSDPLERDIEVLGQPRVELAHTSDNPHADLFVRISEVDRRGHSRNITEAYARLEPGRKAEQVSLALRDTAHLFRAGSRIRLIVAGGSHPQYARNLGTGENPGTGSVLRRARHAIHYGAVDEEGGLRRRSRLILPAL